MEDHLRKHAYRVSRLYDDRQDDLSVDDLYLGFGGASGLRIEPVIAGAKSKGIGKVIAGTLMVAGAFFTAGATLATATVAMKGVAIGTASFGITYGQIATWGALMALSGVSMMLTPLPETQKDKPSYLISATGNITRQGAPVPIVFGRCWTGSVVISSGTYVEEI